MEDKSCVFRKDPVCGDMVLVMFKIDSSSFLMVI
jgi:hypothetical protein